jgi:hypothetical protein
MLQLFILSGVVARVQQLRARRCEGANVLDRAQTRSRHRPCYQLAHASRID